MKKGDLTIHVDGVEVFSLPAGLFAQNAEAIQPHLAFTALPPALLDAIAGRALALLERRSYFMNEQFNSLALNRNVAEIARRIVRIFDNDCNSDIEINGESGLIKFITSIRTDGVFFDVGANKGDWSAKVISADFRGRLVLVDPLQKNIDHLEERFKHLNMVICKRYAVSDTDGEAVFYSNVNDADSGTDSLYDMNEIGYETNLRQTRVSKIRLDELTQELAIERIHLLKIDVEGHDYSVLRGAERLFSNGLIDFVQIEFGHAARAARVYLHDIVNFLKPFGYSMFIIKPNGIAPLRFTPFVENRYSYINLLLVRNAVSRELAPIMLRE